MALRSPYWLVPTGQSFYFSSRYNWWWAKYIFVDQRRTVYQNTRLVRFFSLCFFLWRIPWVCFCSQILPRRLDPPSDLHPVSWSLNWFTFFCCVAFKGVLWAKWLLSASFSYSILHLIVYDWLNQQFSLLRFETLHYISEYANTNIREMSTQKLRR